MIAPNVTFCPTQNEAIELIISCYIIVTVYGSEKFGGKESTHNQFTKFPTCGPRKKRLINNF